MPRDRDELELLKARVSLAAIIARCVKLRRVGADHFGLCPFHDEKTPSFSVNDRKGFFHCFGCRAHGDVLDWYQRNDKLSFTEALEKLRQDAGRILRLPRPAPAEPRAADDDADTRQRQAAARGIWRAALPIAGSIAETYLRQARGISIPLPNCLRFMASFRANDTPALVAGVEDIDGIVVAIQRTFLKADGSGKADIPTPKRALGPIGRGAVCLAPAGSTLGLAEGLETGLSAMELFRLPVWCVLGSNLARVTLPPIVRNVVIFADRGNVGEHAAEKARQALHAQRRRVAVQLPKSGDDFNDELKARRRG